MPPPEKGKPPLPPQPRHRAVVSLDDALPEAVDMLQLWVSTYGLEAPAFSGGILDAWPAEAVDAWPIFAAEAQAVREYAKHMEAR